MIVEREKKSDNVVSLISQVLPEKALNEILLFSLSPSVDGH